MFFFWSLFSQRLHKSRWLSDLVCFWPLWKWSGLKWMRCQGQASVQVINYVLSSFDIFFQKLWNLCLVHVIFDVLKLSLNLESLFSFNFPLKKAANQILHFRTPFKLLRCLNSKEIKLRSSIRVICIILDLIPVQLKI